jgi:HK97 gp10 family phage protein
MAVVARLDTKRLDRILEAFPEKSDATVRAGAEAVLGRAVTLAPVDTGALKNSIHAYSAGKLRWEVSDGVEYGIYQEFGTSRHRAQPFMRPASEWARPQWLRLWQELERQL